VILRRQETIEGAVEIAAEALDADLFRITVRIINRSPLAADQVEDQEAVLMRTFASTHTVLHVEGGKFLSLIDPPAPVATCAAECKNIGTWPVLRGGGKGRTGCHDLSPIPYDYPKIAPESSGDLFDAAEIDEILTLRIMSMTDGEKHEMRHVDEQARRILERTEALPEEHLLKMHGALRNLRPLDEDFFNPKSRIESVNVAGVSLHAGSRVRIRPKGRADVMDLALAGKTAVVETIECDAEDQIQLALVLEDDPGKDLGMLRQPGHRFFYGVDEIEPVEEKR
jgi:hydrogenase maturation protease